MRSVIPIPISIIALSALVIVAGCVSPPPAEPPRPRPTLAPPPPLPAPAAPAAADWRDWPVTPGTWTYGRDTRGSRAMFGVANADARLVLRCDTAERRVYLSRAGENPAPFAVRTSSVTRAVPVRSTGGTMPYVAAAMAPTDPLLDAMAFSRGRFAIDQAGGSPLVVPAWAEIGRVIEDCR